MDGCRVMTFNLRRAMWRDGWNTWRYRKKRAAMAILESKADIIGTQEGLDSMLQELSALLPGYAWVGLGRRGGSAGEHNAIWYRTDRWRCRAHGTFWLSESPEAPGSRSWGAALPRICTWAELEAFAEDAGLKRLFVYNLHLDHRSKQAREEGASLAARRLLDRHRRTGIPSVLLGDMNASLEQRAVKQLGEAPFLLQNAFTWRTAAKETTYHGYLGPLWPFRSAIDHICMTEDLAYTNVATLRTRYKGRYPSDHYPVYADIRLAETNQPPSP